MLEYRRFAHDCHLCAEFTVCLDPLNDFKYELMDSTVIELHSFYIFPFSVVKINAVLRALA